MDAPRAALLTVLLLPAVLLGGPPAGALPAPAPSHVPAVDVPAVDAPAGPVGTVPATAGLVPASCRTIGGSRAGRAWLPRARVLVDGGTVLAADAGPGARADVAGDVVTVQRTARRSPAGEVVALRPVVLVLVSVDEDGRTVRSTCTVDLLGPADVRARRVVGSD